MLLWGSLFPLVKLGYAEYSVSGLGDILLFAGIRFTVCGALICLYSLFRYKNSYKDARVSVIPILLVGVFSIILHYGFTYTGLSLADSSKTAILKQCGSLFYVCFSFLFFKSDKLTLKKLCGVLLGFAGIMAISYGEGKIQIGVGEALILLASFCTVLSNVISKKLPDKVNPVTMTGISQLFGGVILLISGIVLGGQISLPISKCYIFILICAASIISYCIWFGIVKKNNLSGLFIIKFAEPVFASIFGALLLQENILKPQYLISFLLISAGIIISSLKSQIDIENKNEK